MTAADHPAARLAAQTVRLGPGDAEQIAHAWGPARRVAAGTVLLRPGERCRAMWLLTDGYARFFAQPDGRDATCHFAGPDKVVTVYPAYASGEPSPEGIELLTDGHLLTISREQADALAATCPAWAELGQATVREVYVYFDRALDHARTLTAAERYQAFMREYPDVLLHVPLRYVASYLGMTPQSLSRVRARVLPDAKAKTGQVR